MSPARHTLEEIRREYDRLDALCGVDTGAVELCVSARATRRLGSCRCTPRGVERITISDFVMDADDGVFYDTIRHEYAHALVKLRRPREKHGHDACWRAACAEVGCAPERCCDSSALPQLPQRRELPYRYRLKCLNCGRTWNYKRSTKVLRLVACGRSGNCTCPYCKGHRFAVESVDDISAE